ncbi:hypothetical protein Y032_0075g919 [Ancylostoma ceylanicum]|uniref:Fibronectin type-III domain-containing protein n=1 Tax=Ancylostoma ceylanicum TaxID=53326 RepID=A0A016TUK7_9BILA|nr:hypothetical protein Y032_0075g919 [Ancylostoma ceylanicum]
MVRKFQDLVVSGISTNILSDKVVITWNIAGLNEFEKPLYVVSIWSDENGVRLLKQVNTTETMHELGIARRPWKFQLEVLPVIGEYVGIASDNVTIDLEEMDVAPTDIEAVVISHSQVFIDFEPISNIYVYGEDKGCEVQICEKQEDSPTCLRKTVPPRAGGAEFNDLKPAKIYYAQVACLTNAGKGLPSSWIAFRNADLTAPSITTTKKTRRPKFVATTDSYQDSTLVINIRAQEGLSLVIVWSFNTKGGALFDIGLIKKFQLLQYKKDIRGTYSDRLVITDDPKKREIDVGRYWRKQKTIGFVQKRETDEKNGHKKYDNKNITKNVKSCFDLDHG